MNVAGAPSCPTCRQRMSWHEETMRWVCKPCLSSVFYQVQPSSWVWTSTGPGIGYYTSGGTR